MKVWDAKTHSCYGPGNFRQIDDRRRPNSLEAGRGAHQSFILTPRGSLTSSEGARPTARTFISSAWSPGSVSSAIPSDFGTRAYDEYVAWPSTMPDSLHCGCRSAQVLGKPQS